MAPKGAPSKGARKPPPADDDNDLGRYLTIAVSDCFMAACCLWAASKCWHVSKEAAVGFAIVGAASSVGTLRFSVLNKKPVATLNRLLAEVGGMVGIPLIGLGFLSRMPHGPSAARHQLTEVQDMYLTNPIAFIAPLAVACMLMMAVFRTLAKDYTTVISLIAMSLVYFRTLTRHRGSDKIKVAYCAIALFVIGGALVGPHRHQYLLGVRKENIFHYLLGSSMVLFALAI
eukprot:TRINITY_DN51765_c0_g1_i1.p1 TRINITY_DN51765_c0_g1~~TRINITY_DN51765_c0_g1_i1.p1  ORF type:complete len:230 (+),score=56.75 TRINITY_DN51765_c0_g1_i1:85-774(+)